MALRLSVAVLALGSGWAAFRLSAARPAPETIIVHQTAPAAPETDDVLIANNPLDVGKVLRAEDLAWIAWPKNLISEGAIRRSLAPQAREEATGAIVRASFIKGEPLRMEKIVQAQGAGVLAAILPSGHRAMAISIDAQGATSAGGFILPNDRVDVIRTLTRADNPNRIDSETILANVRVLAIGQNSLEKNGERVITATTATLEVDPQQAEILAQAQRSGQISLALRSLRDASEKPQAAAIHKKPALQVSVMRGAKRQDYPVQEGRN